VYPKSRRYRTPNKHGDIHSKFLTANGVKKAGRGGRGEEL